MIRTVFCAMAFFSISIFNTANAGCSARCTFSKCSFGGSGGTCVCGFGFAKCYDAIAQPNFGDPDVVDLLDKYQAGVAKIDDDDALRLADTLKQMVDIYRTMDYPRYLALSPVLERQYAALSESASMKVQSVMDGLSEEKDCSEESKSEWTQWLNRDGPSGKGDYETVAAHSQDNAICAAPTDIQCRSTDGRDWTETGQKYYCEKTLGGRCVNSEQSNGRCLDYEVRFACSR